MQAFEVLPTLAELALGIIGFSGIIVVLGRHEGVLSELERFRIGQLLAPAIAGFVIPLVTLGLHDSGLSLFATWRYASLMVGGYSLLWMLLLIPRARYFRQRVPGLFHWPTFWALHAFHIANVLLQGMNASGYFGRPNAGLVLFGIILLLAHSVLQFTRLLFFQFHLDEAE